MPFLSAISCVDFPYRADQQDVKAYARKLFAPSFSQVDRMLPAFDHTGIVSRNFCRPLDTYGREQGFHDQNLAYIDIILKYAIPAIENCMREAGVDKAAITDLVFISTTGLSTPSLDARLVNAMQLNPNIRRTPVFGLGCAGGVAGYARASAAAIADPEAIVLLVAAELCSLTFLRNDTSKSNFIGSSLFADGIATCIIKGDAHADTADHSLRYKAAGSKLYYDTLDVMGWEFMDEGFKVLFSQDIPGIISKLIYPDVDQFLRQHGLEITDIKNFIFHPGGMKVLQAYESIIPVEGDFLEKTRDVMVHYGNMSSATVLYVLERFFRSGFEPGYSLMLSLGPGFCAEMVLLDSNIN